MNIRAFILGALLVVSSQGLYAEQHNGPDDFHMGPVPNAHEEDNEKHDEDHH